MERAPSRATAGLTQRLWWSGRPAGVFDAWSLAALVGAFCLYLWGGAGIAPLAAVAFARITIGASVSRGRSDAVAAHTRARPPKPRRYRYPVLVVAFVAGVFLGGILGWNELAYAILAAGLVGARSERWAPRLTSGHRRTSPNSRGGPGGRTGPTDDTAWVP